MREWKRVTFWWVMVMVSLLSLVLVLSLYGVLRVSTAG